MIDIHIQIPVQHGDCFFLFTEWIGRVRLIITPVIHLQVGIPIYRRHLHLFCLPIQAGDDDRIAPASHLFVILTGIQAEQGYIQISRLIIFISVINAEFIRIQRNKVQLVHLRIYNRDSRENNQKKEHTQSNRDLPQ